MSHSMASLLDPRELTFFRIEQRRLQIVVK